MKKRKNPSVFYAKLQPSCFIIPPESLENLDFFFIKNDQKVIKSLNFTLEGFEDLKSQNQTIISKHLRNFNEIIIGSTLPYMDLALKLLEKSDRLENFWLDFSNKSNLNENLQGFLRKVKQQEKVSQLFLKLPMKNQENLEFLLSEETFNNFPANLKNLSIELFFEKNPLLNKFLYENLKTKVLNTINSQISRKTQKKHDLELMKFRFSTDFFSHISDKNLKNVKNIQKTSGSSVLV
jgi:hypothetical protein